MKFMKSTINTVIAQYIQSQMEEQQNGAKIVVQTEVVQNQHERTMTEYLNETTLRI